jgi:FkbM family methyltransferase
MTVVDLGAHIGYYSVLAAMEVGPSGHVYAFEPDPFTLPLLRRNVQACGYEGVVTVVPKAVSNTAGKTELFLGRGSGITSIYRARDSRRGPVVVERGTATVETISLNAYFAELGWPPVDLVKMDIEGAERVALEGMLELARRNPRLRLIVEFCPQHIKDAGATPEELFKSLRRVGFARIWVASDRLKPVHVPQDLPWLIKLGDESTVNLLCEKEEA